MWSLDPETLAVIGEIPRPPNPVPAVVRRVESTYPGIGKRVLADRGSGADADSRYFLTWETLGNNRDRPREEAPPPSMLRVVKLRRESP